MTVLRRGRRLGLVALLAVVGAMSSCYWEDASRLPSRTEAGVWRSPSGEFFAVIEPCGFDRRVASFTLSVAPRSGSGELTPVLNATLDPPLTTGQTFIPLGSDTSSFAGIVEVRDAELLRRFNEDESFLTDVRDDQYFRFQFFDESGDELRAGTNASSRFQVPLGQVGLASGDYPLTAQCTRSDDRWQLPPALAES